MQFTLRVSRESALALMVVALSGLAACESVRVVPTATAQVAPSAAPTATPAQSSATPAQSSATVAPPSLSPLPPSSTMAPPALLSTGTPPAEVVVITPDQFSQLNIVHVGQTISIISPRPTVEWDVVYDPDLFQALTPPEQMKSPGPEGWQFRAVAPGQGQIVLTSIVTCNQSQPCPPMPAQFTLLIEVR